MSPPRRRSDFSSGFPPPSKPRAVDGGLVARSARGDIGEQWWSRRFLTVLESFALGSRLTRGKNYARRGQVVSLSVAPGVVTASVQGSRARPYKVSIGLPVFTELVWAKVEVALAEQAVHSARLLAGEMPPDLEEVFLAAGAPLFPRKASDLDLRCSCPDWEVPCKHLAATFYLLAERFDDDPFDILLWRGRPRAALLSRLRELRGAGAGARASDDSDAGHADDTPVPPSDVPRVGAMMALADVTVSHGDFWATGPLPPLPVQPEVPTDVLLRQLPPPGVPLGGRGFVTYLTPIYAAFGAPTGEK